MPEEIDRALERETQKPRPQPPVRVTSLADIMRIVGEFAPAPTDEEAQTITSLRVYDEDAKREVEHRLSTTTKAITKRAAILDGLRNVTRRNVELPPVEIILVNGKAMPIKQPTVGIGGGVDALIRRWFDAERDGNLIKWNIGGVTYLYDVEQHRLIKRTNA